MAQMHISREGNWGGKMFGSLQEAYDRLRAIVDSSYGGIYITDGSAVTLWVNRAYEDITGQPLNELAKLAGTQELVITAELADTVGNIDAVTIVNELKGILDQTKDMTDDELREQIRSIASQYNVTLTDGQVDQLLSLCRSLEGLSSDELKARVEQVQGILTSLAGAQETVTGILGSIKGFFEAVGNFFANLFN